MTKSKKTKTLLSKEEERKLNINHLIRISGQLDGVKSMMENGRDSLDILIQLKALRASLRSIENSLLKTEIYSYAQSATTEKTGEKLQKKFENLRIFIDQFKE